MVEQANRPDRNLDAMIRHRLLNGVGTGYAADAPAYTASLDAALTLVPDGWAYAFSSNLIGPGNVAGCQRRDPFGGSEATAATPALALCAAALRARAANV